MKTSESIVLAISLSFLCALGAYAFLKVLARRAYNRCEQIELPTTVATLGREFGAPVRKLSSPSGTVTFLYNPVPLYWEIASGSISATTIPPSTAVTSLWCGEGL